MFADREDWLKTLKQYLAPFLLSSVESTEPTAAHLINTANVEYCKSCLCLQNIMLHSYFKIAGQRRAGTETSSVTVSCMRPDLL